MESAEKYAAQILTYDNEFCPRAVFASNYSLPVFYVRDNPAIMNYRAIAVVGSRNIREPYTSRVKEFTKVAVKLKRTISSRFSVGADNIGHQTAFECRGVTLGVMPCGLDHPFPPENRGLWKELLSSMVKHL